MKNSITAYWLLLLFSCNSETTDNKETALQPYVDYDSLNKINSTRLLIEHNTIPYWQDSVFYSYIYQYSLPEKIIPFKGYIIDIIKEENKYMLSVDGTGKASAVAYITLDSIQFKNLTAVATPKHRKGVFIIRVNRIIPTIEDRVVVETVYDSDEVDLKHALSRQLQIKGSLIDFYIYKYEL